MSLVQRLTSIEGSDRQPPQLPEDWLLPQHTPRSNGYGTLAANGYHGYPPSSPSLRGLRPKGSARSLRRVISYDPLPGPEQPSQATNPTGGITAYKISNARRIGGSMPSNLVVLCVLTSTSASRLHSSRLLAGLRYRLRVRSSQACAHRCWRVPPVLYQG